MPIYLETIPDKNLYERGLVGQYWTGIPVRATANTAVAANVLRGRVIFVPQTMTFDTIAVYVATGHAEKNAYLGVYNLDNNLAITTLVKDYGTVSVASSTTLAVITADLQLSRGYYLAALLTDGTPTLGFVSAAFSPLGFETSGYWQSTGCTVNQAYGALPDPFTAGYVLERDEPALMLKIKSYP